MHSNLASTFLNKVHVVYLILSGSYLQMSEYWPSISIFHTIDLILILVCTVSYMWRTSSARHCASLNYLICMLSGAILYYSVDLICMHWLHVYIITLKNAKNSLTIILQFGCFCSVWLSIIS